MTYASMAALSTDLEFRARLGQCLYDEANGKVDDQLADQILTRGSGYGPEVFMPWISTAPGFAAAYEQGGQEAVEDGMILSAVQAAWNDVADLVAVPPVP